MGNLIYLREKIFSGTRSGIYGLSGTGNCVKVRFDDDREKIFRYYLSKVSTEKDLNIERLAKRAVYKTPADIANLVKESALITTVALFSRIFLMDLYL